MLSNHEVEDLKNRVSAGGDVWWNDGDGVCKRVRAIKLDWVEFADQPDDTEPAALLVNGGAVALNSVEIESFVVMLPCLSAEGQPDNLTVLQNAKRNGLVVNFMTGDISLPAHLMPGVRRGGR